MSFLHVVYINSIVNSRCCQVKSRVVLNHDARKISVVSVFDLLIYRQIEIAGNCSVAFEELTEIGDI